MKKIWIVIVVVLALVALWWFRQGGSGQYVWPSTSSSPVPTVTATTKAAVAKPKATATATPTASYSQLVLQFGSNRIQFDNNCRVQPSNVVFKNGTQIMLDNRSSQTQSFTIGGTAYTLPGYGYQIITLSQPSVPKNLTINCGSSVNVGTIQLQAAISGQ